MHEPSKQYTIELKESQYKYLEQMAERHNLPDVSKALRCLVNFAKEQTDQELDIFQQVRCNC